MQTKQEAVEKAFSLAKQYEKECTGCAQSCVAGIFGALGMENDDVFTAASGLADGLGITGDGSCGALVGGALVIGLLFGRKPGDFQDPLAPMRSYELVKQLHGRFVERFGSCRCHDIQKNLAGRTFNFWEDDDIEAALELGLVEHCSTVAGTAAALAVGIILDARQRQESGTADEEEATPRSCARR